MEGLAGRTFVVRVDHADLGSRTTLPADLAFLIEHGLRPIVVAPSVDAARFYVRVLNRHSNVAVGLSGADAALLPARGVGDVGNVQPAILTTLTAAGYLPVIAPTALRLGGDEIEVGADDVAAAIAAATEAARALFFHDAGGVIDPRTAALIAELTPAEAFALADGSELDVGLRAAMRAAARGVRAGVSAAQILDGRIAHATIVELLTAQHLGTQVTGSVYLAG